MTTSICIGDSWISADLMRFVYDAIAERPHASYAEIARARGYRSERGVGRAAQLLEEAGCIRVGRAHRDRHAIKPLDDAALQRLRERYSYVKNTEVS